MRPHSGLNVLIGRNAQGKTSLLEAVYLAALARSWRTLKDAEMVRFGSDNARIWAEIVREQQSDIEIEVKISRTEKKKIAVNRIRRTRLADLVGQVHVLLIEPHDVDIVRGEPSHRRRFLNIEISQIQPQYCHLIANYRKILEQRNRFLKDCEGRLPSDGVLDVLNQQFVTYASGIIERRISFVREMASLAREIHSDITDGCEELDIEYACRTELEGAASKSEIAERLIEHLKVVRGEEIGRGMTLVGPQRDDMIFRLNGLDARTYGSQGQQRTIALSLRLAEMKLMEQTAKEPPIVLLDDVMTDLDEERRSHVFEIARGGCQTFLTGASRRGFDQEFLREARVFNISEGMVKAE